MTPFPSPYDAGQGDNAAPEVHADLDGEPGDPFQRFGAQVMADALFRAQRFADTDPTYRADRRIADAWREACYARRGTCAAERRLAFLVVVESAIRDKRRGPLTRPAKRRLAHYEAQLPGLRDGLTRGGRS
jgi:hypothetical protein